MDKLPTEIKEIIFKYMISNNKYYTTKEINYKKRDLALIYLTFKEKKENYEKYCHINDYINIYNKYQSDYDKYIDYKLLKKQKFNEFSPILIDLFNQSLDGDGAGYRRRYTRHKKHKHRRKCKGKKTRRKKKKRKSLQIQLKK